MRRDIHAAGWRRKALAVGIVSDKEAARLESMRIRFGLSGQQVENIARQVREDKAGEARAAAARPAA